MRAAWTILLVFVLTGIARAEPAATDCAILDRSLPQASDLAEVERIEGTSGLEAPYTLQLPRLPWSDEEQSIQLTQDELNEILDQAT